MVSNKQCPNLCSGNGYCGYVDTNTDESLFSCPEGRAGLNCAAQCKCNNNYVGASCADTGEEMVVKAGLRQRLLLSLASVIESEDPSESALRDWVSSLVSVTKNPDELSKTAVEIASNITQKILLYASAVGANYRITLDVMEVANVLVDLRNVEYAPTAMPTIAPGLGLTRSRSRRHLSEVSVHNSRRLSSASRSSLDSTIDLVGGSVISDMMVGQADITLVQTNFRLSAIATSIRSIGGGSSGSDSVAFSPPSTVYETAVGAVKTVVNLEIENKTNTNTNTNTDQEVIKLLMVTTKAKLFAEDIEILNSAGNSTIVVGAVSVNSTSASNSSSFGSGSTGSTITQHKAMISNVIKLTMDCNSAGSADKMVYFTMPHVKDVGFGVQKDSISKNFTTQCRRKHIESFYYHCPETFETLRVDCNGQKMSLFTRCPAIVKTPACYVPDKNVVCTLDTTRSSANSTVCGCKLCDSSITSVSARRNRRLHALTTLEHGQNIEISLQSINNNNNK